MLTCICIRPKKEDYRILSLLHEERKKKRKKHTLIHAFIAPPPPPHTHTQTQFRQTENRLTNNGVARMLKKLRTSKGETTVSSNDSLQLSPFSKWSLLLKERICSQREQILSFTRGSKFFLLRAVP